jgi:hypothetical protein
MAATALHVIDNVLPDCPTRQWVVSFPFELRLVLAADAKLFGAALKVFVRVVERYYLERAGQANLRCAKTGMLSFQQRFGGSINCHPHVHMIAIDGVFALDEATQEPRFHFVAPPTPSDMHRIAASTCTRVIRLLRRRGLLGHGSKQGQGNAMQVCRTVGLSRGRLERLDKRGHAQQELYPDELRSLPRSTSKLVANENGFSVEAGVHLGALNRKGREKLVRYCLRPAIAGERLSLLRDGSIAYRVKVARGGKTHRVMRPMESTAAGFAGPRGPHCTSR